MLSPIKENIRRWDLPTVDAGDTLEVTVDLDNPESICIRQTWANPGDAPHFFGDLVALYPEEAERLIQALSEAVDFQRKQKALNANAPDPDKLDQLADWLDVKHPNGNDEVQQDLRRWAKHMRGEA